MLERESSWCRREVADGRRLWGGRRGVDPQNAQSLDESNSENNYFTHVFYE
ncbi:hypothetical protein EVAR_71526_1, partial [Eumeta japonica]